MKDDEPAIRGVAGNGPLGLPPASRPPFRANRLSFNPYTRHWRIQGQQPQRNAPVAASSKPAITRSMAGGGADRCTQGFRGVACFLMTGCAWGAGACFCPAMSSLESWHADDEAWAAGAGPADSASEDPRKAHGGAELGDTCWPRAPASDLTLKEPGCDGDLPAGGRAAGLTIM